MKEIFLILVTCCFLFSCGEVGFYEYSSREDLSRIPLIEPYELISTLGSHSDDFWFFKVENFHPLIKKEDEENRKLSFQMTSVNKVAIHNDFIFVHSDGVVSQKGDRPAWLVVNLKTDEKEVFYYEDNPQKFAETMERIGKEGFKPITIEELSETFLWPLKLPEEWHQYRHLGKPAGSRSAD